VRECSNYMHGRILCSCMHQNKIYLIRSVHHGDMASHPRPRWEHSLSRSAGSPVAPSASKNGCHCHHSCPYPLVECCIALWREQMLARGRDKIAWYPNGGQLSLIIVDLPTNNSSCFDQHHMVNGAKLSKADFHWW